MLKRCVNSFIYSAFFGMLANFFIECFVRGVVGATYSHLTPEYLAMFPSYGMAYGVDLLLYGLIGLVFSAMLFIYEVDRLGFVLQNLIYYITTGVVWIPIVTFMWQLQNYAKALPCVIMGFVITDIIMTIVGYQTTKQQIVKVNAALDAIQNHEK
ncbi:MAG: DUF3021 family protein [Eubacteriales bacterium]|nr:DUF3021 family protein [Eubacteriales bacterium]